MCVVPLTDSESSVHLFLHCDPVAQIWSWLGEHGEVYQEWDTRSDVINYAVSLGSIQCKAFLTVVSATCWAVWKARNNVCFNEQAIPAVRNLILTICSFVSYWAENMREEIKAQLYRWLPMDVDMIPIQSASPLKLITGTGLGAMVPVIPVLTMA